jgi:hypothetical protein
MPRYKIHGPWLSGKESNGTTLLPLAIEKLREAAVGKMVFTGDSMGGGKTAMRNVVGGIHEENGDLIIVAENDKIFAPPGKSSRVEDYAPSFCITAQNVSEMGGYDILESGGHYSKFLDVECVYLVDKGQCDGWLERL